MPIDFDVERTIFGKTELSVSRLGFGAAPVGFLDTPRSQIQRVVDLLFDHGVNLFDTAACYPGSEEALGQALAGKRDDVVLVSKCGNPMAGDDSAYTPEAITADIDRSLQRLGTDHVDVMLLHSCSLDVLRQGDALGALGAARDAGKVRFLGYSGDNDAAAWAAERPEVSAIEMSVNLVDQHNLDAVLPVAKKHDVGVIAKRPVANACWKDLESQPGMYRSYAKTYTQRFVAMGVSPSDLGYSGHVEVEWPEIALKFTLAHEGVHTAICGTTSTNHAEINLQAAGKNPLRDQAVLRLREAFKKARADGDLPTGLNDWNVRWVGEDGYQGIVARQLQEFKKA
ncbi:MAG: aldo/keto reductase, partial [Planctomycetota bacterium]